MRLSKEQHKIITQTAQKHFGMDVRVHLFGSRVDDQKKGGDIDLLIHAGSDKMLYSKKLSFLVDLKKQLGERKIDIVFDRSQSDNADFIQSIKQSSILL
ncbi:MAG: nucleotidyltransferase domain-containing protein [Bacteroidales bacterium]|nr:nucleotidyltransferase domain-containing protein [Bacteroidales bacterium]